jgi:thioesterase domain-containing protein
MGGGAGRQIEALVASLGNVGRFSMLGYSMGGLIARYVVGRLYERGFFERVQPMVRPRIRTHMHWHTERDGSASIM